MATTGLNVSKNVGVFGWNYNRANYKYDQTLRWQRYTSGRKQAMAQIDMFREDVADLAGVSTCKLKVYGPIYGVVVTVCVTVLVEGRSGLKFPGPPVFISAIYLQCLAIGMSFISLGAWLLFHAAMRAQIACVQLRTRMVRVPAPTQRQLDGSRKLLSTWEEQGLYDMLRVPFILPNGANSPENSDEEEGEEEQSGYNKGGVPGVAHKVKTTVMDGYEEGAIGKSAKVPGFTPGNPSWYQKELEERKTHPEASPSGHGMDGPDAPFMHFELLRNAQKEWWGCEAYMRVCFLFGMVHLILAFSYWITLHNIAELGMIWCSNLGAAGLTAGVWIIFRMDVLPAFGGCFPFELGGPFVTSIALGLMYSQQYTQTTMDIARGVAILIIFMHIFFAFRMYSVAKPTHGKAHQPAHETGGRLFNRSGSCEAPAWLPSAFQHVMYLVAPPKTQEQLAKEKQDRDHKAIADDPIANVDMTPWHYVRTMIFVVGLGWVLQLGGRAVECAMGERMLVSNPGQPPWTRTGMWYGWEHGPISSKHYAHVTPQRGHWAWQKGWGPQGQQELWASDMFGFAPEADAWWGEDEGPEPKVGAAGHGRNSWNEGVLAYGQGEGDWGKAHESTHDWLDSGGHRRLSSAVSPRMVVPRPMVPVPVQWPAFVEPDLMACAPDGHVAAFTTGGLGALVPPHAAAGHASGLAKSYTLEGLLEHGMAHSVTWDHRGFLVVAGLGSVVRCLSGDDKSKSMLSSKCAPLPVPALPGVGVGSSVRAAVLDLGSVLRAFVSGIGGRLDVLELRVDSNTGMQTWSSIGAAQIPFSSPDAPEVIAVTATSDHLLASDASGASYRWPLHNGFPAMSDPVQDIPVAGQQRAWQSACALPDGRVMRLASGWRRTGMGRHQVLAPELLL